MDTIIQEELDIPCEKEKNCGCGEVKKTERAQDQKRMLTSRLNRIIGQLNGIKNMIAEDRYCGDILMQLSAAEKSVKSLATVILDAHMKGCMVRSIEAGDLSVIDEMMELFKRFQD